MVRPLTRAAPAWALPLAAAIVALPFYAATLEYGFRYDDYYLVRPHSAAEVLASFTGTWDPGGVMAPFYRPLTVAFHALRFELFHLDARTHHAVSVALFVLAAAGLGFFVSRVASSRWLGIVAAAFVAAHPGMPAGAVAWITNQMHLLQMLTFVAAVLWWTVCRTRPARWWLPLFFLQVVGFLVKEDGIILLPTVVTLHVLYGAVVESRWSRPPLTVLVASGMLLLGLIWWRDHVLGGLGGYARPTFEAGWHNYWRGLQGTFLQRPPDRRWQPLLAAVTVVILPAGMIVAARRQARRAGFVLLAGMAVAALYNVPFALVTKTEQYYMLAAGAAMAMAGALGAIGAGPAEAGPHAYRAHAVRATVVALAVSLVLIMGTVARDIAADFGPYFPFTLETDEIVLTWGAAVPPEIRGFLEEKRTRWARGRERLQMADRVSVASYGLHDEEVGGDGRRFRWTTGHARFYARCTYIQLDAEIRALHPDVTARPVTVTLRVDGSPVNQVSLASGRWTELRAALPRCSPLRLSSTRKVELDVDRTWSPAAAGGAPGDSRQLGVMLRSVRWSGGAPGSREP